MLIVTDIRYFWSSVFIFYTLIFLLVCEILVDLTPPKEGVEKAQVG